MTHTEAQTRVLLLRTAIHKAERTHGPVRALRKRLVLAVARLAAMEGVRD